MSENLPTKVQLDANQNGSVTFATDVISTIAGLATNEVEGVTSMAAGWSSSSMLDILGRRGQSSTKNLTKGVKVELIEGQISIQISVIIDYGIPIPEIALNIQENVKKAVETMSGLTVSHVDVQVQGISFEREMRNEAEIEMPHYELLQDSEEPRQEEGTEKTLHVMNDHYVIEDNDIDDRDIDDDDMDPEESGELSDSDKAKETEVSGEDEAVEGEVE